MWENEKLEGVADSFGAQLNTAVKVGAVSVVCFSSMEVCWHWNITKTNFLLVGQDLFGIFFNLITEVFFVDHVKSGNKFS
jgi:hypothetical protein